MTTTKPEWEERFDEFYGTSLDDTFPLVKIFIANELTGTVRVEEVREAVEKLSNGSYKEIITKLQVLSLLDELTKK